MFGSKYFPNHYFAPRYFDNRLTTIINIPDYYFNTLPCATVFSNFNGLYSDQSIWLDSDNSFNFKGRYTLVTKPGELEYIGTEMDDKFNNCSEQNTANYLIRLRVVAKDESIVSITGRRDNEQYIQLKIDTVAQTVSLIKHEDSDVTLDCQSYSFNDYNRALDIQLVFIEDRVFGFVDGGPVVNGTTNLNINSYGASILIDAVPTTEKMTLIRFYSMPVSPYADPQYEDPQYDTNLYVQYRKQILDDINSPNALDWDDFKLAHKLYSRTQGVGLTEEQWTEAGYPMRRPATERFLNPPEGEC